MKFENTTVTGIENAIIGLRLPMSKSFEDAKSKSDSVFIPGAISQIKIGDDDLRIVNNLLRADGCGRAGEPNSKFMRMIHVQVAITAPLYWWKEFDTYKVGTVANSTSTMHKLATTLITKDCFEMDDYAELDNGFCTDMWNSLIEWLEGLRQKYNETKVKAYWKELIRLLPESWLQTRMIDCNFATLRNIYAWRRGHKLTEWHSFCDWICTLPLHELITAGVEIGNDAKS